MAVDDGVVIGFISGHRTRRLDCDGEVQWLNVAIHKRGLGVADQLIARIGAWFFEQHARRVCVNVA